jgi:hypothetical protein
MEERHKIIDNILEITNNNNKIEIKSGKWKEKEDAVKKLIKLNEYCDYYLIKPNNWDEYLNKINKI